ncbi:MAG: tRNA pseudouridine(55) synthase TruB [Opitutaceae bacterium]|nr:tRNA pseudouridine(55) synthase TruB [Opitutaceae bacterium]|tara:strand:+ start:1018 stop:1749 length:732 start_codon:yes stop_codon:yes gene_type:complete
MAKVQNDFEGVLLIDKPSGITSHDVVDRVRRKLKMKRVGHAGTLDPLATGLLIILVGKATKLSSRLMSLDKEYEGTLELGKISDSHDVDGEILETRSITESINEMDLLEKMSTFIGDQYQTPPMFSAVKVKGVPLYKHARKGKEVEREPRFIRISKFDLCEWNKPFANFYVYCTKGTYIRSLVHDLGEKLGCGAILTGLRRTASNNLTIDRAVALENFEEHPVTGISKYLIPGYKVLSPGSEN